MGVTCVADSSAASSGGRYEGEEGHGPFDGGVSWVEGGGDETLNPGAAP